MLAVEELNDPSVFETLASDWRALAARSDCATVFQTQEWISSWWSHFGEGQLRVLVALENGTPIGIAPLFRSDRLPGRIRFIGTGRSSRCDVLAHSERLIECVRAFARHLERDGSWDLIDLRDIREGKAYAAAFRGAGLRVQVTKLYPSLHLPLSGDWETFARGLGRSTRRNLRYHQRLIERHFDVKFTTATRADLAPSLEALFDLHTRRFNSLGKPGWVAGEAARSFLHEVAERLANLGMLRLHTLTLDGIPRTAELCFAYKGATLGYITGFDPTFSRYSLGNLILAHAIDEAIREGCGEFDLLRGNHRYKTQYWRAVTGRWHYRVLAAGRPPLLVARGWSRCKRLARPMQRAVGRLARAAASVA